jgi:hypothetical protein
MLHKIDQVCADYFNWVRQLQNDLLTSVCTTGVTQAQVTPDWFAAQFPIYPTEWLSKLCDHKDKISNNKQSFIEHLQNITNATPAQKQIIIEIFTNNQEIEQGFINDDGEGHRLRKITEIEDVTIQKAYRGFFSIFYDPEFYNGYPVANGIVFNRKSFLKQFSNDNEIGVCVLCDGDLGDPDVDHFYSKKEFPDLSLHIGNLVPICKSCNSRARKGEKAPLDFKEVNQFANWYHPYYRIANNYCVQFELRGGLTFPILESEDETEKIRLQNLNDLIGLKDRWRTRLRHIVRTTIKQLRMADFEIIENKILEMADSKACEIGNLPFGILHTGYLRKAGEGCELLLEELKL